MLKYGVMVIGFEKAGKHWPANLQPVVLQDKLMDPDPIPGAARSDSTHLSVSGAFHGMIQG